MILVFLAIPHELWKAMLVLKKLEELRLFDHLRSFHLELLELNGYFLLSLNVLGHVDLAEGPAANHLVHFKPASHPDLVRNLTLVVGE